MGPITSRLRRCSRKWWDATAAVLSSAKKQRSCQTNYAKRGRLIHPLQGGEGCDRAWRLAVNWLQPPHPLWRSERGMEQRTKCQDDRDRVVEGRGKCYCGNPERWLQPPGECTHGFPWGGQLLFSDPSVNPAAHWHIHIRHKHTNTLHPVQKPGTDTHIKPDKWPDGGMNGREWVLVEFLRLRHGEEMLQTIEDGGTQDNL